MKHFPLIEMVKGLGVQEGTQLLLPVPLREERFYKMPAQPTWQEARSALRYILPRGVAADLTDFCRISYAVGSNPLPHLRSLFSVGNHRPDIRFLLGSNAHHAHDDHLFIAVVLFDEPGYEPTVEIRVHTPDAAYYTLEEIEAFIRA